MHEPPGHQRDRAADCQARAQTTVRTEAVALREIRKSAVAGALGRGEAAVPLRDRSPVLEAMLLDVPVHARHGPLVEPWSGADNEFKRGCERASSR